MTLSKYFPNICLLICMGMSFVAQSQTLRLGTNVWPGYEPLYFARNEGKLSTDEVRLVEYRSATQVMNAMKFGAIDAAALTLDEAISLTNDGIPLSVILITDISNGGDVILSDPKITAAEQLKGKVVGVEDTALGAYMLSRFLELHQLSMRDISLKRLPIYKHEGAFKKGKVDAVVTFEPVRSKLIEFGASTLFSSSEIAGEIVDVIVVRSKQVEKFKKASQALKSAWSFALEQIKHRPDYAYKQLGSRLKLNEEATREAYAGLILPDMAENQKMLQQGGQLDLTIRMMKKTMMKQGLLMEKGHKSSLQVVN